MKITAPTISHQTPTNLTTLTSKHPQFTQPHFLNLKHKNPPLFLTHCSTKPSTNQKPTHEHHPNSNSLPNSPNVGPTSTPSSLTRGLIFDLGPNNSWDSLEIGSPVVKRFIGDEEERWYMWYHGSSIENPNLYSIGLAVSSNGVHWERGTQVVRSDADVGLVMKSSEDWWAFDTLSVRPCEVVIMSSDKVRANSGVYWLYYTGFCSENVGFSGLNKSLPGLAMSQDGRHWARIEGEDHTGALLDVGTDGEWDSSFIASPHVVFHSSGDLRMYYHSFDVENGRFAIGIARSRDGMRWVKLGKVLGAGAVGAFDERGVANARVSRSGKRDGVYLMVYEGVGADGKTSVGMAVSRDGLKDWRRVGGDSPVFERSGNGGWDCEGVGYPCLVQMDGDMEGWRLYYRGIGRGGKSGIGLAVSQGSCDEYKFERWNGFGL